MNLIEQAIDEIRQATIEYVVARFVRRIDATLDALAEADWEINVAFPYPTTYGPKAIRNRAAYKAAVEDHLFAMMLTAEDETRNKKYRSPNDPNYRVRNQGNIDRAIQRVREAADFDFQQFIIKLTGKIGLDDVETVILDEQHKWLWDYSILHVTRNDGTKEKWKTQIITKVSCLGNVFNQWPTRKVK